MSRRISNTLIGFAGTGLLIQLLISFTSIPIVFAMMLGGVPCILFFLYVWRPRTPAGSRYKGIIWWGLGISFILFFTVVAPIINKRHHKWVKSSPVAYVYETYHGAVNPVLVIESLKYKDSLIKYYDKLEEESSKDEDSYTEPYFNFPLKTLPQNDPVFVIGYTEDSLLAKVVSYYDRGPLFGGNYLECYVYSKTLHFAPPPNPDSPRINFEKIIFHTTDCGDGRCPIYHLEVGKDRSIKLFTEMEFEMNDSGTKNRVRNREGYFVGKVSDTAYNQLLHNLEILEINNVEFDGRDCCDGSVETIILYYDGKRKFLKSMTPPRRGKSVINTLYGICWNSKLKRAEKKFFIEGQGIPLAPPR